MSDQEETLSAAAAAAANDLTIAARSIHQHHDQEALHQQRTNNTTEAESSQQPSESVHEAISSYNSMKRPRLESNAEGAAEHEQSSLEEQAEEAGLSLLFEASLLQQPKQDEPKDQNETIVAATASNDEPPATLSPTHETVQQPTISEPVSVAAAESLAPGAVTLPYFEPPSFMLASHALPQSSTSYTNLDVLCGRGGFINKHHGNILYRHVVERNKAIYRNVPKRHRMLVSQSIVQAIMNRGGRFLMSQKNNNSNGNTKEAGLQWSPIHYQRAVAKTSQALREPPIIVNNGGADEDDAAEDEKDALSESMDNDVDRLEEFNAAEADACPIGTDDAVKSVQV